MKPTTTVPALRSRQGPATNRQVRMISGLCRYIESHPEVVKALRERIGKGTSLWHLGLDADDFLSGSHQSWMVA